jgi:hypothetical protein
MYEFNTTIEGWKIHWGVSGKSNPKAPVAREVQIERNYSPQPPHKVTNYRFEQKETGAARAWPYAF